MPIPFLAVGTPQRGKRPSQWAVRSYSGRTARSRTRRVVWCARWFDSCLRTKRDYAFEGSGYKIAPSFS
ncbi:hypothetical protein MPNT_80013 [Candidatus Methylacidithermus pantelleriae]|uniref:Uncharacterized protein n=1 Tax=Candidatus Methylacidithermus pantelleriae TaxID=2744239 RepID=A0A8J2BWH7_9BACT|nr:hypothetical protein MPNT_80013 [Candidatus Methylacidithermus pantelleriae]